MKRPKTSISNRKQIKPIMVDSGPRTDGLALSNRFFKKKTRKRCNTSSSCTRCLSRNLKRVMKESNSLVVVDKLPPPSALKQRRSSETPPPIFGKRSLHPTKSPQVIYESNEVSVSRMRALEKGLVRQLQDANIDKMRMAAMLREQEESIRILRQEDIQSYYQEQVRELKRYVSELKGVIEEDTVAQEALQTQVLEQQEEMMSLKNERNQIWADLNQSRSDHRLAIDELTTRTEQFNNLKTRHADLTEKLEERVSQIKSLRATRGSMSSMIKKMRAENQDMKAKYGLFDKQIELLMRDNRKLEYENEDLRRKVKNQPKDTTSFSQQEDDFSQHDDTTSVMLDSPDAPTFSNNLYVGDEINVSNADFTLRRYSINSGSWQTAIADLPITEQFTFKVQLDDIRADGEIKIGVVQPDCIHVHTQDIGEVRGGWCLFVGDGQMYHHNNTVEVHQPEEEMDDMIDMDNVDEFLNLSSTKHKQLPVDYEFNNDDVISMNVNVKEGSITVHVNDLLLGIIYMDVSGAVYPAISFSGEDNYQVSMLIV